MRVFMSTARFEGRCARFHKTKKPGTCPGSIRSRVILASNMNVARTGQEIRALKHTPHQPAGAKRLKRRHKKFLRFFSNSCD